MLDSLYISNFRLFNKLEIFDELNNYARQTIAKLPHRVFSQHHQTKALLYSWLAWQKRPGLTLDVTVNGKLLDFGKDSLKGFLTWLGKVYSFIDLNKLAEE